MKGLRRSAVTSSENMAIQCFMSLMVVLIPILLVSVEFAQISIIDMTAVKRNQGVQFKEPRKVPFEEDPSNLLRLTAIITDSTLTLGTRGAFLPTLRYREYYDGDEMNLRVLTIGGSLAAGLFSPYDELLTDISGTPVDQAKPGDTLFALNSPRRFYVVKKTDALSRRSISVGEMLQSWLISIKESYPDAADGDELIIASEPTVLYDKLVQLMDVARKNGFPDISIARLGS